MEKEEKPIDFVLNEYQIKLEVDGLWEQVEDSNVKKELLDHDYCMQNPVKQEEIDNSYENSLEPKIEEPDDSEYTKYLKLEKAESEQDVDINKQQHPSCSRKCALCLETVNSNNCISISSKKKQAVLMVGLILRGTETVRGAQFLYSKDQIYTCVAHLKDALDEIYKALNITNIHELNPLLQRRTLLKMMKMIKYFHPTLTSSQFHNVLIDCALKTEKCPPTAPPSNDYGKSSKQKAPSRPPCKVCSSNKFASQGITSSNEKLIFLIGCILSKRKTVEEAQLIISQQLCVCCKSHSTEAVDWIFRVLNIKTIEELSSCPRDDVIKLTNIAQKLSPGCTSHMFKFALVKYVQSIGYC